MMRSPMVAPPANAHWFIPDGFAVVLMLAVMLAESFIQSGSRSVRLLILATASSQNLLKALDGASHSSLNHFDIPSQFL